MANLTDNQLEILYQITDVHFEWFKIYTDSKAKYEEVLKLNHQKLMDIADAYDDCDEDSINFIFQTILDDYTKMLDDYESRS